VSARRADLLIRAGRVFCTETGLDGPGAVAVRDGRIVASGPEVGAEAGQTFDFPDCLLLPGLVDMHAHPAPVAWNYGMDADHEVLPRGTTTMLSQGDAGAATWEFYRDNVIEPSRARIRLAISPALQGESEDRPSLENLDDVDPDACVEAIRDGGEHIWGIAVNVSPRTCGANDPREVMRRTLDAAERTGKPLLFGARAETSDWPLADQLALMRPGDVVTYCFRAATQNIVAGGRVVDSVWGARDRGVLFDVGHGMRSFDFGVAEAAIADGFLPDTISTDFYKRHVGTSPRHDLPRTISKLIAAGMSEADVLERSTASPASVLGLRGEVGTLGPGACADLAVLRWDPDAAPLADAGGATRPGGCWEPVLTVRAGEVVRP
jgi:dihydroorotase